MNRSETSALVWRKSSFCGSNSTCVELATLQDGGVAVRDGKDPSGPALQFTAGEWITFLAGVRSGEFQLSTD